jgi:hypothetical protein
MIAELLQGLDFRGQADLVRDGKIRSIGLSEVSAAWMTLTY